METKKKIIIITQIVIIPALSDKKKIKRVSWWRIRVCGVMGARVLLMWSWKTSWKRKQLE